MSKYRVGDVIYAPISYFNKDGYLVSQDRRWIIVKVNESDNENITVSLTGKIHQQSKYPGILVKKNSNEGIAMGLDADTFIYCNTTVKYLDHDIKRRIGVCPIVNEIILKLGDLL